jgi:hypothetical protein
MGPPASSLILHSANKGLQQLLNMFSYLSLHSAFEDFKAVYNLNTIKHRQVLVAHACNLSYSGGKYQEGHGSKPA